MDVAGKALTDSDRHYREGNAVFDAGIDGFRSAVDVELAFAVDRMVLEPPTKTT